MIHSFLFLLALNAQATPYARCSVAKESDFTASAGVLVPLPGERMYLDPAAATLEPKFVFASAFRAHQAVGIDLGGEAPLIRLTQLQWERRVEPSEGSLQVDRFTLASPILWGPVKATLTRWMILNGAAATSESLELNCTAIF